MTIRIVLDFVMPTVVGKGSLVMMHCFHALVHPQTTVAKYWDPAVQTVNICSHVTPQYVERMDAV